MAESSVAELSKLKLAELRRELKARGLSSAGAKSELLARLQEAAAGDEAEAEEAEAEYTLDSDEIDSDGVLEESDIMLDESALGIDKPEPPRAPAPLADPALRPDASDKPRALKRKHPVNTDTEKPKDTTEKDPPAKKIVLHRPASIPATEPKTDDASTKPAPDHLKSEPESDKKSVTIIANPTDRLKLRAQRFGLPMTEEERKEARKIRFGRTGSTATTGSIALGEAPVTADGNIDKLKKRAERFGQSVSKAMTDVDAQERLEKRRAKFGLVN